MSMRRRSKRTQLSESIVRRDDFRSYEEFLTDLAKSVGDPDADAGRLARVDRKRKKKGSNKDWVNPHDPDAQISKMKDGRTHLAHKQEHAVDMDSGAVVAVTLHGGVAGTRRRSRRRSTLPTRNTKKARETGDKSKTRESAEEAVGDKGYHSKRVNVDLALAGRRPHLRADTSAADWEGEALERDAVYADRGRKRGSRGQRLMRRRGESWNAVSPTCSNRPVCGRAALRCNVPAGC